MPSRTNPLWCLKALKAGCSMHVHTNVHAGNKAKKKTSHISPPSLPMHLSLVQAILWGRTSYPQEDYLSHTVRGHKIQQVSTAIPAHISQMVFSSRYPLMLRLGGLLASFVDRFLVVDNWKCEHTFFAQENTNTKVGFNPETFQSCD